MTSAMSWSSESDSGLMIALFTSNWIFSLKSILLSRSSTRGGGFGGSTGFGGGGGGGGGGVPAIANDCPTENGTGAPPQPTRAISIDPAARQGTRRLEIMVPG